MSATVNWYIPAHIAQAHLSGAVEPEEIARVAAEITALIKATETPLVHVLIDLDDVTHFSKNMSDYMNLSFEQAPNTGWRVFVGGNVMMRFISNILANRLTQRLAGSIRMTCVANYDEAIRFIAERDPYLTEASLRALMPLPEDPAASA